jgi:hypothetical protein
MSKPVTHLSPEVEELAQKWSFVPTEELEEGYCSKIFANESRVLKFPWRGEEKTSGWKMALALSKTIGPEIYECDESSGALLMERIIPGMHLSEILLSEKQALALAAQFREVCAKLPTKDLMPVETYFENPNGIEKHLLETTTEYVALHGDLHHENILLSHRGWLLIDPKGLVGDPAFEAAAFIRNPYPGLANEPNLEQLLANRIHFFANEWNCDPWRVWAWSTIELEDLDPSHPFFPVRETLLRIEPKQ